MSQLYTKYKEGWINGGSVNLATDTIKVALVNQYYSPDFALHDFYNDVSSFIVGTPVAITSPTVAGGVFDGDDVTFTAPSSGVVVQGIVVYKDAGTDSTSPLIFYGTVQGFPFTTNGGDVNIRWSNSATKIFAIAP